MKRHPRITRLVQIKVMGVLLAITFFLLPLSGCSSPPPTPLRTVSGSCLPWPEYYQQDVLSLLRAAGNSSPFNKFYEAEAGNITQPVHWVLDNNIAGGFDAALTNEQCGNEELRVIHLQHIPARLQDAQIVTHEMEHEVMTDEGFPTVGHFTNHPEYMGVAEVCDTMISDPMVESRLHQYGFDTCSDCKKEEKEWLDIINTWPNEPTGYQRDEFRFVYVKMALCREMACDQPEKSDNSFLLAFAKHFPNIALEAQDLLTLVKTYDLQSPEDQTRFLNNVITKYKLDGFLGIKIY